MHSGSLLLLRHESHNTKSPDLVFSAVLAENIDGSAIRTTENYSALDIRQVRRYSLIVPG